MTGQEMVERAASLLGYTASNGNMQLSSRISAKALDVVNQIYSDLWRICRRGLFLPLATLSVDIDLPERAINEVMPYGVAMFLAQTEEDSLNHQIFTSLYNQKRAGLSVMDKIQDTMPRSVDL